MSKWFVVIAAVVGAVVFWQTKVKTNTIPSLDVLENDLATEEMSWSRVEEFSLSSYSAALSSGKLVVLYFYANWCPECKAEFPKLEEAITELSDNRVAAFRVNYKDNQTEVAEEDLARQFGVAYQHTKVFLRGTKNVLLKNGQSWDKNRYLTEIHKFVEFYDN